MELLHERTRSKRFVKAAPVVAPHGPRWQKERRPIPSYLIRHHLQDSTVLVVLVMLFEKLDAESLSVQDDEAASKDCQSKHIA